MQINVVDHYFIVMNIYTCICCKIYSVKSFQLDICVQCVVQTAVSDIVFSRHNCLLRTRAVLKEGLVRDD